MALPKDAVAEVDAFLAKARSRILRALENPGKRPREVHIVARLDGKQLAGNSHIDGPREYLDDPTG